MSDSSSGKAPTTTSLAPAGTQTSPAPDPILPETVAQILASQGVPPGKVGVLVQQITTEVQHRLHAGPIPPVEDFRGYNDVCPGAARDILDMAMRQQRHRHFVEKLGALADFILPVLGLIAAVAVIAAMLGAGVYLALHGFEKLAFAVISGTGLATVGGAFLQSWKPKKKDAPPPVASKSQPTGKKRKGR
jgi:uncharacterized membrane protein